MLVETCGRHGLGWHHDLPDYRDYVPSSPPVEEMLSRLKRRPGRSRQAAKVDLREYFPDVYDQQHIHSSTAHACIGLVEYYERRSNGRTLRPSQLFLYKTARRLLGTTGDSGADLRTTLKAMTCFGIPPQRYWHCDAEYFDEEPDAFHYSFADQYRSIHYLRLDARNTDGATTLDIVKSFLAAGLPCVFGFAVSETPLLDGEVPYRPTFDRVRGGLAVVAVGYDDRRMGATKGALLIRNSWGTDWGESGYGWLPYAYVQEQLAADFWTILKPQWLESGEFERPRLPR